MEIADSNAGYNFIHRFLQRAPVAFLQCSALNTILECGLQACMLDHKVSKHYSVFLVFYIEILAIMIQICCFFM